MDTTVIILAAGKGLRMRTGLPKPLHPVGGKPILARLLRSVQKAGIKDIFVVMSKENTPLLEPIVRSFEATPVLQDEDKPGTAGACDSVPLDQFQPNTLIINGDHPLIQAEDLQLFIKKAADGEADMAVGTCNIADPKQMGRILRQGENIERIIESYDFTEEVESCTEINTGLMLVKTPLLEEFLPFITNDNPKEEYPITDLAYLLFTGKYNTKAIEVGLHVGFGVNTQEELALANSYTFEKKINSLMEVGVIFPDPQNIHIEEDVYIGSGSIIYPGVYLKGETHIGSFSAVEQNCHIYDCQIGDSVLIKAFSYLEKSTIKPKCIIGPFAHIRPNCVIGEECKVGNFSELKNTEMGNRSKSSHVSYLGDSIIGEDVNIGCGTVTCNYTPDKKKYQTHIGDGAFVGSGSMLIAPVVIGENSVVGAGSVISKDVPADHLAIERAQQQNKKKKKKSEK